MLCASHAAHTYTRVSGPVIGPLLGGVLAQNLGWRSTFTALAIFAGVMFIAQVFTIPVSRGPHASTICDSM